jgi:very-short-patch-repair endonuclease
LNKDGWRVMRVWEHEIIKSSDKVKNNIVAKFFNE